MNIIWTEKIDEKYTLVKTKASYTPFVIAFKYDPVNQDWAAGHYFRNIHEVVDFLYDHFTEYIETEEENSWCDSIN